MKSPRPSTVWNSRLNKAVVVSKTEGLLTLWVSSPVFMLAHLQIRGEGVLLPLSHQVDARGGAQGGGYRRQDGDGELDDFLPKFFFHDL
jgi:hypothetical protein